MLWKSVHDPEVSELLPATKIALARWTDETTLPPPASFDALSSDLKKLVENARIGELALRLNREQPGFRQLIERSANEIHGDGAPLMETDRRWSDPSSWRLLKRAAETYTPRYLLNAVDMQIAADGSISRQDEQRQIYLRLFGRTIFVAAIVTGLCAVIGYPFAYALASAKGALRSVLFFVVMLPFWTSLLVRTTAWIVILQRQGVLNELLVSANLIGDNERFALIYNFFGTVIAMVYVLLPFFILPLQAVMRGIPGQYVRAAESLGGNPMRVFGRIYLPMTMPGVAAGGTLVFILSLGYYVTPALVGGRTGQLISNQIAFHIQSSLNWGLASALGTILLAIVVVISIPLSRAVAYGRPQR
ncbi:MAG: ABC transporter permease [Shinella sp.]|nr:ABC transporter permease [Shinella sp.]